MIFNWKNIPVATGVLISANIAIWLVGIANSETAVLAVDTDILLDFGAMFSPLIAEGEFWRLLTAIFLHHDLAHIFFNSFGLFIFGRSVERIYGHNRFVIIYILTGLSGSVTSYVLSSIGIGAGASGAIFGVLGSLAAYLATERHFLGNVGQRDLIGILIIACISLIYGLATPGVDNWAHLGGFVAGLVLGLVLAPRYRASTDQFGNSTGLTDHNALAKRWYAIPLATILLILGAWLGTVTLDSNAYSHLYRAEQHLNNGEYDLALRETEEAIRVTRPIDSTQSFPAIGETQLMRARIYAEIGDTRSARNELGNAIRFGDQKTKTKAIALLVSFRDRR